MDAPQTLGKYDILDLLGVGGMGTVYRARDRVLERVVAVKLLHPALAPASGSEDHRVRFLNEARAVARLNHPNIVSLFDFSDADPAGTFFAMEYVEGCTVADIVEQTPAVRLGVALPLIRQLLNGLEFAHVHGVVHRDIKPSNLLVSADHRLKISDFGIATMGSARQTMTGIMVGTPTYMAPERYCGERLDARCDVYSAAVVLYELLTGRRLFSGALTEIIYQVCHVVPDPASRAEPAVPALLDSVLAKGLAKDPDARYQTAGEFAAAIAAVAEELGSGKRPIPNGATDRAGAPEGEKPTLNLGPVPTALVTQRVPHSDATPCSVLGRRRVGPPTPWPRSSAISRRSSGPWLESWSSGWPLRRRIGTRSARKSANSFTARRSARDFCKAWVAYRGPDRSSSRPNHPVRARQSRIQPFISRRTSSIGPLR